MPKYLCIQFGQCGKADAGEEIEILEGAEPKCPQCGQKLEEAGKKGFPRGARIALVAVPAAALLCGLLWFVLARGPEKAGPQKVEDALAEVWPWLRDQ